MLERSLFKLFELSRPRRETPEQIRIKAHVTARRTPYVPILITSY